MRVTRRAEREDLPSLLALYLHLTPEMPAISADLAESRWREILASDHVAVYVSVVDRDLVASCTLITAPNLMRGGTPHGFLENVVTHTEHRRQGHGRAVIEMALADAWRLGCQRVLLVTGRARLNPHVLSFYESCGFQAGRAGLMAPHPGI